MAATAPSASDHRARVENGQWSEPVTVDLTRTEKRVSVPKEKQASVPRGAGVYAICAEGAGKGMSDSILDIGECGPRPSSGRGLSERLASAVAHSASERIAKDITNGELREGLYVVWALARSKEEAEDAQDALICLFRREFGGRPKYNRKAKNPRHPDRYTLLYENLKTLVGSQPAVAAPTAARTREAGTHVADPPTPSQRQQEAVDHIVQRLRQLSIAHLDEVKDFVDSLSHRHPERELTRLAMAASRPVLDAVWDNPDDAEYDAL